ncbi:keratin, type I cytoskeletal 15-like isoform X2 [Protopterus annectens]|uniref:keratin, type I cytoskeletal 15-like isoform X2 n=1 Tax=Protopterus annectens TaxID=7888 RepID=UPI001CF9A4F6|nr:keratin, type I cytoskeletal 15-like isoform X2 [Protopterus annectens]
MYVARKAVSVHGSSGGGGRMQVSTIRPLAAAGGGHFSAGRAGAGFGGFSSGGGSSFSFSPSGGSSFGGGGGGFGSSFGVSSGGDDGFLVGNEKITMQNLNDRLGAYLEKVHCLEDENHKLELKIKEWYSQQIGGDGGHPGRDYSPLEKEILELQNKIIALNVDNSSWILKIDNAKLAADDFRTKYENELALRKGVEADILGLQRVLDELIFNRSDLEMQIEGRMEELDYMKKSHDEDMRTASSEITGQVNVELDAAPSTNLVEEMNSCRKQYEAMAEQIRQEAEKSFNERVNELKKSVDSDTEVLSTHKNEISNLSRHLQSLEIELQSQLGKKATLERALADTEQQYGMRIQEIQFTIHALEEQLANIRIQMESQSQDYQLLLNIKQRLEQEIETYRILLEGEDSRHKSSSQGSGSGSSLGFGASSSSSFGIGSGSSSHGIGSGSSSHGFGSGSTSRGSGSGSTALGSGSGSGSGSSSIISQATSIKVDQPKPVTPEPVKEPVATRKTKVIIETIVDGKIQSTEVKETEVPITR